MHTLTLDTPGGQLTAIADDDHTVLAAGFCDAAELAARLGLPAPPPPHAGPSPAGDAVAAYVAGDLGALDRVHTRQAGTDFQQAVWSALRAIPPGETASYAEIAAAIGRPQATRAVGSACGRNLIAPFVPCHRAVRTDGSLGGYAYGLAVKGWLLSLESGQGGRDEARAPAARSAV
ncbi:methylated-DNA--[protein]-cysteine S-methyltransferase [Euzebya sp.]|uniref:methylated-DNA--[protein]-cysteine S-methyltransferase n=1 Tax=Euzebya sp. TaxID=1971409 RepID=UPI0035182BDD